MGVDGGEPVPLRRNRDFQLLWSGQAVSLLGSQTSRIAYPLLVLAMTGSPAKAGIAGFAAMLGYLLFPLPAGALADRHDRKRIMIGCDAIRLAAVGSIAVAYLAAHLTYAQILLAGFAEGSATIFFSLAERAALPMLVHPSQRSTAISQNEARANVAQLAGPALGGALFGLSRAAPFAADALSYLASLVTLPFIRTPMQAARRDVPARTWRAMRAELAEGLAFTWREPFLRYASIFGASVNLLLQVVILGLIVLGRHDGASPAQIGIIVGCLGAGGIAGALAAPWFQRRIPAGLTITGCMWIWALLLAVIAAVHAVAWLYPTVAVIGFVGPAWNVSAQTFRMKITPNELLGRTSSVSLQIAWGVIPLGSLLAGFLLQVLSPPAAMAVVAAVMAGTAVAATALAAVRNAGRQTPGAPGSVGPAGAAALRGRAQVGGEGGQVEQVEQGIAPPLARRPVVEVPQALVRRVQDRPQHGAFWLLGTPGGRARIALQDRRRLPGHGHAERPGQQQPLHRQDAIVVSHFRLASVVHRGRPAFCSMMRTGSDIPGGACFRGRQVVKGRVNGHGR
jgi:predicted MFS family arabinose efflux permease